MSQEGPSRIMVSDSGKNFEAIVKRLEGLKEDDKMMKYLRTQRIKKRFNFSRAP